MGADVRLGAHPKGRETMTLAGREGKKMKPYVDCLLSSLFTKLGRTIEKSPL